MRCLFFPYWRPHRARRTKDLCTEFVTFRRLLGLICVVEKNPSSFAGLYSTYAREIYRFVLYMSGNSAVAQDVTSDVFLRVWTLGEPAGIRNIKAWLLVIARNLYLRELRHIRRSQPLDPQAPASQSVEMDAASRQQLARVREAIRQLPKIDRAALLMRVVDDLPYEEIGANLRISVAAAKVKVHRARLRLESRAYRKATWGTILPPERKRMPQRHRRILVQPNQF